MTIRALVASLVAQRLKCLPPMRETWVRSLGREDPPEKEMVTHSIVLTWEIPWTGETDGLQAMGLQRVRHDLATKQQFTPHFESSFARNFAEFVRMENGSCPQKTHILTEEG